ncbi:MAG TPA: hypothetical protein VMB47_01405 [Candidatus Aquilonibacter sp.]|nr:hypothetical protein [Candidatus Aquilonibacter sp.]
MQRVLRPQFAVVVLVVLGLLAAPLPLGAQAGGASVPVTTVVTVLGPKYTPAPAVSKDDISVYTGKTKETVTDWYPAQGDKARLQLAIVLDDALETSFGIQLNDIRAFINSQPPTTAVGVFYARNGTVQVASQFSTNHDAVAKSVRIPLGYFGAYSSIYLSLMDFMKRWPVTPGSRREILLLADGIDRFRGDYPHSPDVDSTARAAQRDGVMIHSIFCTGVGGFSRNLFRIGLAQGNLGEITDATGGEAFFQGFQTPVSLAPFLDQLNVVLKNQYWLSFTTAPAKNSKGDLRRFRVRTELKGVELSMPDNIFVPYS